MPILVTADFVTTRPWRPVKPSWEIHNGEKASSGLVVDPGLLSWLASTKGHLDEALAIQVVVIFAKIRRS